MENLVPIKKISGDLLLYFYYLQRKNGFNDMTIIEFEGLQKNEIILKNNSDLTDNMLKISQDSSSNAYNALNYLENKGFISFRKDGTNMSDILFNFGITAYGVDIIEGIERGEEEKKIFNVNFNIKLADNINIESLIKNELSSLIKLGLI